MEGACEPTLSLTEELNGMWEGDANISFNEMVDADRRALIVWQG